MKRINRIIQLMALWAMAALALTACSVDDADSYNDLEANIGPMQPTAYLGVWVADKQEVDTARLEVQGVLTVRLPEAYLADICFEGKGGIQYTGQPAVISIDRQGYTENAEFSSIDKAASSYSGTVMYNPASFTVIVGGVTHRVDLLSTERSNAIYYSATGLWAIGISVSRLLVTNLDTREQYERPLPAPVTLYYYATKQIW